MINFVVFDFDVISFPEITTMVIPSDQGVMELDCCRLAHTEEMEE